MVPVGASSVVINVTAINPTSDGFVSLRPGDATGAPSVSTLNVTVGGTFPNGATITLPTSGGSAGQIQIWYEAYNATGGTTDLLIDVVGYYVDHNHDDRYYTENETDTALAGKASASELTSGLAGKADASDLAGKANLSALRQPLAPSLPATIDSAGDVGSSSSIAIGTNGNPIISYRDFAHDSLKVAACNDPTCTTSTNTTIDSPDGIGWVGPHTSIAIGTNGNPIISYYDGGNGDLKVAACNNPTCTTSTNTTIDSDGDVGSFSSIAIGTNGNPTISYYDITNGELKVAACNNPTCTGTPASTNTTIDNSTIEIGTYTSITIGINGNPIISYSDGRIGDLKVAACNNPTCTGTLVSTNTTIDSDGSAFTETSIAIGTNGNPIISYGNSSNGELKVAACDNPTCTTSTNTTIDSDGFVSSFSSIAIGTNGNPIISYYDMINLDLKIAACNNPTCTTSTNTTIDSLGDVGYYTSIAIGTNGNPIISHLDVTNLDLKIAACNNPTCEALGGAPAATNTTIDGAGEVGWFTSMTIGTNGNPIISYGDLENYDLKVFSPWWITGGR